MAKIFVHVTRVKNAMGFEQPITTLTSISGKSKKNDYVCGKCGDKLTRQDVLSSDGTCPKCGEPIHMGTAFLNRQKNAKFKVGDEVEITYKPERGQTGVVARIEGNKYYLKPNPGDAKDAFYYGQDLKPLENGARWSTTDIYPQVEGKRKELIKDPSKSLGETLKPGKPGTLANEEGKGVCSVCGKYGQVSGLGDRAICDKCLEKEMKGRNSMPPDSGFEKEAAIAERRGSSAKNNDEFEVGDKVRFADNPSFGIAEVIRYDVNDPRYVQVRRSTGSDVWVLKKSLIKNSSVKNNDEFEAGDRVKLTPSAKRMPSTKERGVGNLTGIVTSVKGDDLMVKFEDGQSLWFMTHELLKFGNSKNADRSRPTDVDTWDEIPGLKNADFEIGDTVTVDKPEHGNQYHGMVGTVMELHGDLVDVRFAGVGTLAVHVTNLRPGGRRKNADPPKWRVTSQHKGGEDTVEHTVSAVDRVEARRKIKDYMRTHGPDDYEIIRVEKRNADPPNGPNPATEWMRRENWGFLKPGDKVQYYTGNPKDALQEALWDVVGTVDKVDGYRISVNFPGVGTKQYSEDEVYKVGNRPQHPDWRKNQSVGERKSNPSWLKSKDEGKWSKAKEAVKKEYGEIKWPVVTKVFEKMGGKPK